MKRTLLIDQLNLDDSFIQENGDILPNGFDVSPKAYMWFYYFITDKSLIKNYIRYTDLWYIKDKGGSTIISYSMTDNIYMSRSKIWYVFLLQFKLNPRSINELCIPILKQHFNCENLQKVHPYS